MLRFSWSYKAFHCNTTALLNWREDVVVTLSGMDFVTYMEQSVRLLRPVVPVLLCSQLGLHFFL